MDPRLLCRIEVGVFLGSVVFVGLKPIYLVNVCLVRHDSATSASASARSVLQEQEEATRARRYRFLKQNEREKLTYYLELKKIQ